MGQYLERERGAQIVNACFRGSVVAVRATPGVGAGVLVRNYWINTHCVSVARTTLIVAARPTLRRVIMLEFLWVGCVYLFRILLSGKFDRLKRRSTEPALVVIS